MPSVSCPVDTLSRAPFGLTRADYTDWLAGLNPSPKQIRMLMDFVYTQDGYADNGHDAIPCHKALRSFMRTHASLQLPSIARADLSSDGSMKALVLLHDGHRVEMVIIPAGNRTTLCVSSQVGCSFRCRFCATGTQGYTRNLTTAEIIGQVVLARRWLRAQPEGRYAPLSNVVFMGMGEPLLNRDAVVKATHILMDDWAFGLSKHRVTISTSGVVPLMKDLRALTPASLALSLHAATDELRDVLVPINKKAPLAMLKSVCQDYFKDEPKRSILIEYVMLDGVNDRDEDALALVAWAEGLRVKINLIPFHPYVGAHYACTPDHRIKAFAARLKAHGLLVFYRKSCGLDIQAACGQLVGQDRASS